VGERAKHAAMLGSHPHKNIPARPKGNPSHEGFRANRSLPCHAFVALTL